MLGVDQTDNPENIRGFAEFESFQIKWISTIKLLTSSFIGQWDQQ